MNKLASQFGPFSPGITEKTVLVVGFRTPIVEVLQRLRIPFSVWAREIPKREFGCRKLFVSPFPSTADKVRAIASREFAELGPFTDVIAGTEASVFPASVCRRALGARKSSDSIALRCSDKLEMKMLLSSNHVPMTHFTAPKKSSNLGEIFKWLGPKVVIKERRKSGGRGISFAKSVEELEKRSERGLLYEKFVDANEMSIESFVKDGEIQFESSTNYVVKTLTNIVPANVPTKVLERAIEVNRSVIKALKLKWGMTHAEFYWNDEEVLFGEIALRPPGGYIMECISNAFGFDVWEAFVANELNLPYQFPSRNVATAGVAMFHAGTGIVEEIENTEAVSQLKSFVRFKSLVKPGERVNFRVGVSDVSAYGMFVSEDPRQLTVDVQDCRALLRFRLSNN